MYDPNDPTSGMGPQPAPAQTRYNTTANWQDPFNPPSPGDPYWGEWIAANPGYNAPGVYPGSTVNGPQTPTPASGTPDPYAQMYTPPVQTSNTGPTNPGTSGAPTPAPTPDLPPVTPPPAFAPPPAFVPGTFTPPTGQDVLNDPSYQFDLSQGLGAIGHKAAALGTLNTGGTIGDYVNYGQGLASTHYDDLFNQKLSTFQTNESGRVNAYNTNYGTQVKDPYTINYQTQFSDPFAARYQSAIDTQNSAQHNYDQSQYYNAHTQDQTNYYDLQNRLFGHQVTQDDFNNRLRLLGLIQ